MGNNMKQYQDAMDSITIAGRIMDTNLGETMTDTTAEAGVWIFSEILSLITSSHRWKE